MSPAAGLQPGRDDAIRVNLEVPVLRLGVGIFSFDPLEQLIGASLADLLAPLLCGPVTRRPFTAGPALDVFPLSLPAGEGVSIPLGAWGELGVHNERGLLRLSVPAAVGRWVEPRLGGAIVHGPEQVMSFDQTAWLLRYWVQLRAGMRASFPVGMLGEVGVEAG